VTRKAIIVGAGIGGLSAAATLRRVGLEVEIYERAPDLRTTGSALSLMSNAVLALRALGIEPKFEKHAQLVTDLHFRTKSGRAIRTLKFKPLTDELGAPSFAIHRRDLQRVLADEIGDSPVTFGAVATGFASDGDGVEVSFEDGRTARGDLLIGADGFNSAIRRQIAGPERPRDGGYVCWLATPHYEDPRLPPGFVAHYWGSGARFGIADIGGGRIYWWGTKNMSPERARTWRGTRADVLATYAGWAGEVTALIEATPEEELLTVPAQDRPFLEQWGRGPVTLLGDAAHPMLTSVAQGAAVAVEDAVVLARHLANAPDAADVPAALRAYEDARRARTKWMVELSWSMSRMEQSEGPLRVALRNTYFRFVPRSVLDRHNRALLDCPVG
jgi:2-polyprenyl-6-methoxyphenol hydroxylase-like FAD-dependent oxidoreductase